MAGRRLGSRWAGGVVCALCLLGIPSTALALPETEPNNSVNTGTGPLVDSTTYNGSRENGTDEDWYYFGVLGAGPLTVSVTITNDTSFTDCRPRDPDVCFIRAALRNKAGELLADNGSVSNFPAIKSGTSRTLDWTLPGEGTYTLQVLDGDVGDHYDVTVTGHPALISDPVIVPPPPPPPPPPPLGEDNGTDPPGGGGGSAAVPKTCAELVGELRATEAKQLATAKLYSKALRSYAKYSRGKTKKARKRKAAARQLVKTYGAALTTLDIQVNGGVAALGTAKCTCDLLTRELGRNQVALAQDTAALKVAKRRERKARSIKQFLRLHRATAIVERRIRLARSNIVRITAERAARACTT